MVKRVVVACVLVIETSACGGSQGMTPGPGAVGPPAEHTPEAIQPVSYRASADVQTTTFDPMRRLEALGSCDSTYPPVGDAGSGGLSSCNRYRTRVSGVRVYRVVGNSDPSGSEGEWWTFEPPSGTVANFRRQYAVCEGWNTCEYLITCTLAAGVRIDVGPGQSVSASTCREAARRRNIVQTNPNEHYEASDRLQVYVPRKGYPRLADCEAPVAWPN